MDVRGGDHDSQGQTGPVADHVDLAARSASVDRVRAGQNAPFTARTLIESTTALDQSMPATRAAVTG
ncbi:hypothetical protein C1I99_00125 [Micromonospora deserti]|uniref:Uncharacterized protein n=1 Tax=Micromonospora deserti TaxID=2070366 RepID=A0A2W2CWY6_9ACTN|nr:hypothetical protein C1I99_00125 [Micromonospora deserti]